jgi:hypothetical protein
VEFGRNHERLVILRPVQLLGDISRNPRHIVDVFHIAAAGCDQPRPMPSQIVRVADPVGYILIFSKIVPDKRRIRRSEQHVQMWIGVLVLKKSDAEGSPFRVLLPAAPEVLVVDSLQSFSEFVAGREKPRRAVEVEDDGHFEMIHW